MAPMTARCCLQCWLSSKETDARLYLFLCCRLKLDGPYDSKVLPAVLAVTLTSSLIVVFSGAVMRLHSDS
jgi:hypothetical protein